MAHSRESGEGRGCTGAESAGGREAGGHRASRQRGVVGMQERAVCLPNSPLFIAAPPTLRRGVIVETQKTWRRRPFLHLPSDVVPSHCSTSVRQAHSGRALPPPSTHSSPKHLHECRLVQLRTLDASAMQPNMEFQSCVRSPASTCAARIHTSTPPAAYHSPRRTSSGREAARSAALACISTLRSPAQRLLH